MEPEKSVTPFLQPCAEKVLPRRLIDTEVPGRVEHYDVVVMQILFRKIGCRILSEMDFKQFCLLSQLRHRDLSGSKIVLAAHRTVSESFALSDKQHFCFLVTSVG